MDAEHGGEATAAAGPGPAAVVKEEAARQAVILAGGLVLVMAAAWAERYFTSPDAHRLLAARLARARPRAWRAAERAAAVTAAHAWQFAEAARLQAEGPR